MLSNDEVERRAAQRQIPGHNSRYAFDPPCTHYHFRVIARTAG
jgi:hypothetical protein